MARKVLLVEDHDGIAEVFTTIIEHLGYECIRARNGREGCDKALTAAPDIIFMDLVMPEMNGLEATRFIKATPAITHIPIVFHTASLEDALASEAHEAGVAEILIKPSSLSDIDRILRTQLGRLAIYYNNRGLVCHHRGDIAGALASYTEAVRLNPDYVDAFNNRGVAIRDCGDLDGAIADYSEAIRLRPDFVMAYNNRGMARVDKGDLEGALADYTDALRLKPDDAIAFNNRGRARRETGDLDGALADYTKALQLRPDFSEALHNGRLAAHDKYKQ